MKIENIRLSINLQLFAEDKDSKTEKATPKKKQDARKKGQVFQSREITSALVLVFIFLGLRALGDNMYKEINTLTIKAFSQYIIADKYFTENGIWELFADIFKSLIIIIGPILVIASAIGFIGAYSQVGFLFTTEPIKVKFNRLNPFQGFKRIFSSRGLVELLKAIVKITIVSYITYIYINKEVSNILILMNSGAKEIGIYILNTTINVALNICIALVFFGLFDYVYQWWEHVKNLKMTKQEVKEEYKQIEGNPEIKSKIKQKQRQMSMRRMMHEVPSADVIITNPTHVAVAMKYDANISEAPVLLAKGEGYIALKIKELAKVHNIEIVENKELARTIYKTVDIGEAIPQELYQAVAEILAFVYSLKGLKGGS